MEYLLHSGEVLGPRNILQEELTWLFPSNSTTGVKETVFEHTVYPGLSPEACQ